MQGLLDMVYPRSCLGCGKPEPQTFRYMCWDCWSDASHIEPPFCDLCGDPVAGTIEHDFICYACSAARPAFDGARSAVRYDGVVGEALRLLKYEKGLWLARDMTDLLMSCLRAEYPGLWFDVVVPVPLYPVRRRERSYNQSAVLAAGLARRLRCKMSFRLLRRIRPTVTQTNLTAAQRLSNVNGAFIHGSRKKLFGRKVLLVDDVMTTGATVNACAKALKKGGADSVHVLTVARG